MGKQSHSTAPAKSYEDALSALQVSFKQLNPSPITYIKRDGRKYDMEASPEMIIEACTSIDPVIDCDIAELAKTFIRNTDDSLPDFDEMVEMNLLEAQHAAEELDDEGSEEMPGGPDGDEDKPALGALPQTLWKKAEDEKKDPEKRLYYADLAKLAMDTYLLQLDDYILDYVTSHTKEQIELFNFSIGELRELFIKEDDEFSSALLSRILKQSMALSDRFHTPFNGHAMGNGQFNRIAEDNTEDQHDEDEALELSQEKNIALAEYMLLDASDDHIPEEYRCLKDQITALRESYIALSDKLEMISDFDSENDEIDIPPTPESILAFCTQDAPATDGSSIIDMLDNYSMVQIGYFPSILWGKAEEMEQSKRPEEAEHYRALSAFAQEIYKIQIAPQIQDYVLMQTRQEMLLNNAKLRFISEQMESMGEQESSSFVNYIVEESLVLADQFKYGVGYDPNKRKHKFNERAYCLSETSEPPTYIKDMQPSDDIDLSGAVPVGGQRIVITPALVRTLNQQFKTLGEERASIHMVSNDGEEANIPLTPQHVANICANDEPVLSAPIIALLSTTTSVEFGGFPFTLANLAHSEEEKDPEKAAYIHSLVQLGMEVYIKQLDSMILDYVSSQNRSELLSSNLGLLELSSTLPKPMAGMVELIIQRSEVFSRQFHSLENGFGKNVFNNTIN